MGNLDGELVFHPRRAEFVNGIENPVGIVAQVGGNELAGGGAAFGRPVEFVPVRPGHISKAEGHAYAAPVQSGTEPCLHALLFSFRGRGVDIRSSRGLAVVFMTCKEGHVHGSAPAVHQLQVVPGIIYIDAAVAAHGGGDTHAQHHGEDAGPDAAVNNRVLMHVDVDEAWGDDFPGGIQGHVRPGSAHAHPGDFSVFQEQIQLRVHPVGRINHPPSGNQSFHRRPPFKRGNADVEK